MASGLLALHLYSPDPDVDWERYWRETTPGTLVKLTKEVADALERTAPELERLHAKAEAIRGERGSRAEEDHRRWLAERAAEEQRRQEELRVAAEQRRATELEKAVRAWRLAADIREYAAAAKEMVEDAGLEITRGSQLDRELTWALAYAQDLDPLRGLRGQIEATRQAMGVPSGTSEPAGAGEKL